MALSLNAIITLSVLIYLTLSIVINKKINYFLSGILIFLIGLLPFLSNSELINFNIGLYPIFNFAAYFIIVFAARDFLSEGFKEKWSFMKYPVLIMGLLLYILTTIPTLYAMNIISFEIPVYPEMFNNVLYLICGLFLMISDFTVLATND